jgi:hypothetical protein
MYTIKDNRLGLLCNPNANDAPEPIASAFNEKGCVAEVPAYRIYWYLLCHEHKVLVLQVLPIEGISLIVLDIQVQISRWGRRG